VVVVVVILPPTQWILSQSIIVVIVVIVIIITIHGTFKMDCRGRNISAYKYLGKERILGVKSTVT
jgi:hypothetical protein